MIYIFLSDFLMNFLCANRIAPDGMPRSAASHLGLCCLPMSHKWGYAVCLCSIKRTSGLNELMLYFYEAFLHGKIHNSSFSLILKHFYVRKLQKIIEYLHYV